MCATPETAGLSTRVRVKRRSEGPHSLFSSTYSVVPALDRSAGESLGQEPDSVAESGV